MVGMTSCKFLVARNTSYYGLQVVHCVRRSHQYRKSSKMTKYALRVVACSSTGHCVNLFANIVNRAPTVFFVLFRPLQETADDSDVNMGNNIEMRETQFFGMFCQKTLGNHLKWIF